MGTSRSCRVCDEFHDMAEDWPEACYGHFNRTNRANTGIIKDIDPYQAVAVDVATGKPPVIQGRRQHREFLRRNNYIEVGNEKPKSRPQFDTGDVRPDMKRAIEQLRSRN